MEIESSGPLPGGRPKQPDTGSLSALAYSLGRAMGRQGLDLGAAMRRFRTIESMAPPLDHEPFDVSTLAVALANGWTAAVLAREADAALGSLGRGTGNRSYRCHSLGVDPAEDIALVVFRGESTSRSDTMPIGLAAMHASARAEFTAGESIMVAADRVVLIIHRVSDLVPRVEALTTKMRQGLAHIGMSASYRIEALDTSSTWLEQHLGCWW